MFFKSKYIARSLAFLLIITPMILLQIHRDRELSDEALVQRDANRCMEIKRLLYRNICLHKIAERKESYCKLLPVDSRADCIRDESVTLHQQADKNSSLLAITLIFLELIPLIIITLWSMGLTPLAFLKFLPASLQEVSRAETFSFLRLPIAGVVVFIFHMTWDQLLQILF